MEVLWKHERPALEVRIELCRLQRGFVHLRAALSNCWGRSEKVWALVIEPQSEFAKGR